MSTVKTTVLQMITLCQTSLKEKKALINLISEKSTKAPSWHTEASLLRAMETAGKQVDDEEMRDLMKENGMETIYTCCSYRNTFQKKIHHQTKKEIIYPNGCSINRHNTK